MWHRIITQALVVTIEFMESSARTGRRGEFAQLGLLARLKPQA